MLLYFKGLLYITGGPKKLDKLILVIFCCIIILKFLRKQRCQEVRFFLYLQPIYENKRVGIFGEGVVLSLMLDFFPP